MTDEILSEPVWTRRYFKLIRALKDWPRLPPPDVLKWLSSAGTWPDDRNRGAAMQRELGLDIIPPKSECEQGAGFWDRITGGKWADEHN